MERNYSETLNKAKSFFENMMKEREKYTQQTLDLPKRIEIQTLPLSTYKDTEIYTKVVDKYNKPETLENDESEMTKTSKPKSDKQKCSKHEKSPNLKIESFDLRNMNTKIQSCKNQSSSNSISESLSLSTTESPVSASVKISTSSSTARINHQCKEAIEKAKRYFNTRDKSELTKTSPKRKKLSKVNESTSTKADNNNQNPDNVVNAGIADAAEKQLTRKKGKFYPQQQKITCFEALTPAKKYLKSKLGIDQKSINVKKSNKESFSHSKTHVPRITTKIKSSPNTIKESKKAVNQKESPQIVNQTTDKTPEHLTPAKRYLRSKLGMNEKSTDTKRDNMIPIKNPLEKNAIANTENKSVPRPESPAKLSTKSPVKVRQATPTRIRETNLKKLSTATEIHKREKFKPKTTREKGLLSTKTDIVTSIEPGSRETNKISIELKKPIVLTSSMEELLAKALKIGLKKVNRRDLQDLQLKVKTSFQSRNNISSIISEKSDIASMQTMLETTISNFQNEMERRQKHTFDKIQELENTIQYRKQQLLEINHSKNVARKK